MLVAALLLHRPTLYDTRRRCSNILKCIVLALCGNLCLILMKSHSLFNFEIEIRIMANWPASLLHSDEMHFKIGCYKCELLISSK